MADETLSLVVVIEGFDEFNRQLGKLDKSVDALSIALGNVLASAAEAATRALVDLGRAGVSALSSSVEAAIAYESAFAGVTKTTEGLTDEVGNLTAAGEELKEGFRDLATQAPITFEELAEIGELGGQLGIAQENLLEFTETIAAVGVTTNLTGEEAASAFAQIVNIMGTATTDIDNMASTVVHLGNNFATTERDVVAFAQSIAGAGQIVGLAESDIFAIGAAMSSVGVKSEAGGTAVQKVLLGINEAVISSSAELDVFAKTAGLSAEEFASLWGTNAAQAFQLFVEGLGTAGDDAIGVLQELGLEDQRLIRSFLSLGNAGDLLSETLSSSSDAWTENTALLREAELRYATTESQIAILKNVFRDFGVTVGDAFLPVVGRVISTIRQLAEQNAPLLEQRIQSLLAPIGGLVDFFMRAIETGSAFNEAIFAISNEGLRALAQNIAALATGELSLLEMLGFSDAAIATIQSVIGFIKKLGETIAGIITGKIDILEALGIKDVAIKIIQALGKAFVFAGNMLSILFDVLKPFGQFFLAIWQAIKQTFIDNIWPSLVEIFEALSEIFGALGIDSDLLKEVLTAVFTIIAGVIAGAIGIVMGLLSGFAGALSALAQHVPMIVSAIQEVFGGLVDFLGNVFAGLAALLTGDMDTALNHFRKSIEGAGKFFIGIFHLVDSVVAATLDAIISFIGSFVETVIEFFQTLAEELIGGSIIPDMLDAIIMAFTEFFNNAVQIWSDFVTTLKGMVEALAIFMGEMFSSIAASISNAFNSIREAVQLAMSAIQESVSLTLEAIKTALSSALETIKTDWSAAWTALVDEVKAKGANILTEFKAALAAIGTHLTDGTVLAEFAAWGKTIIEKIAGGIAAHSSLLKQKIGDAIGEIETKINNLAGTLNTYGQTIITKIADGISGAASTLVNAIESILTSFTTLSDNVISALKNIGSTIISSIVSGITASGSKLKDKILELINQAINNFFSISAKEPEGKTLGTSSTSAQQSAIQPAGILSSMSLDNAGVIAQADAASNDMSTSTTNNFNLTTQTMVSSSELELEFATMSMATR